MRRLLTILLLAGSVVSGGCGPSTEAPSPTVAPAPGPGPDATAVLTGRAPEAVGGMPSVVWLEPLDHPSPPPGDGQVFVDQVGSEFFPLVQLARVGEPVVFGNAESVMHNVQAIDEATGETVFNVSTAPDMPGYRHVFERAGTLRLQCGIHPAMLGYVVVSPTPWAAIAAADGSVRIDGVPAGRYRVRVWSPDPSRRREGEIELVAGGEALLEDAGSGSGG